MGRHLDAAPHRRASSRHHRGQPRHWRPERKRTHRRAFRASAHRLCRRSRERRQAGRRCQNADNSGSAPRIAPPSCRDLNGLARRSASKPCADPHAGCATGQLAARRRTKRPSRPCPQESRARVSSRAWKSSQNLLPTSAGSMAFSVAQAVPLIEPAIITSPT